MAKHLFRIIIPVCLVISAVSVFYILRFGRQGQERPSYAPPVANAEPSYLTTAESPDGKIMLTMKEEKGSGTVTYTFLISSQSDGIQKEIFTKTVPTGTGLSIPHNSFSPDNKYLFLKETASGQTSYLVLSAAGAPVAQNAQTFDISSLFTDKHSDYKITDVTGWGGVNLIVFNTDKSDGGQGPSFWFEVPSGAFIQLSNRFN